MKLEWLGDPDRNPAQNAVSLRTGLVIHGLAELRQLTGFHRSRGVQLKLGARRNFDPVRKRLDIDCWF